MDSIMAAKNKGRELVFSAAQSLMDDFADRDPVVQIGFNRICFEWRLNLSIQFKGQTIGCGLKFTLEEIDLSYDPFQILANKTDSMRRAIEEKMRQMEGNV